MKYIKQVLCIAAIGMIVACGKSKLTQEQAERVVWKFMSDNATRFSGWGVEPRLLDASKISSIEPLTQFSDNEAMAVVNFDYKDHYSNSTLVLKFTFNRNVEDTWVLSSVESVRGAGSTGMSKWLSKFKLLNISVE